jgi:glycosyltransferase involved in cell wall biosynthesis
MKIAYVRSIFPKMSETFILEELLYLKKNGHQLRIYATNCEMENINDKMFQGRLFEDIEYHVLPFEFDRINVLAALRFLYGFIFRSATRKRVLACLFPETGTVGLLREAWRREKPNQPNRLGSLVGAIRLAGEVAWMCVRLGNLSLALHQIKLRHDPVVPDVVHAPFLFENDVAWLALLLRREPTVPFTVSLRSRDLYSKNVPDKLVQVRQLLIRDAAEVFTISAHNRQLIARAMPVRRPPVVVYSSIDTSYFTRDPTRQRESGRLLCVARLVEKKGLSVLLDACAELMRRARGFHLTIIGDGPLMDDLLLKNFRLGLGRFVTFAGRIGTQGVKEHMESSQIFVLPCVVAGDGDRDILPNSIKEAMSMELPIVTSRVSGIEELVNHGITGILVKPNDPIALADGIERILSNPQVAETYGQLGRRLVRTRFDIKAQGAAFVKGLESAIALKNNV